MMQVPHIKVVVSFCAVAVVGYSGFSVYAVAFLKDPALIGDVVGTWKSFAVGAFAFWIGASSGGKIKDAADVSNPPTIETRTVGQTSKADGMGGDPVVERTSTVSVAKSMQQTGSEEDRESGTVRPEE